MQVRQQCPDPEQRDRNLSGQPLVTMGGGPCPCRCRRSQQRLPQRESRPKRRVLFSLEFPFLSRHAMHTSCLAAPLVARGSQWFTGSGDSGALQRGLCPRGSRADKIANCTARLLRNPSGATNNASGRSRASAANAELISAIVVALRIITCRPRTGAASCTSRSVVSVADALFGLTSTATRCAVGTSSWRSRRRLAPIS